MRFPNRLLYLRFPQKPHQLWILSLIVEAFSVWTGLPYGEFHYSRILGYRILGLVPVSVGFAYLPILLGSMTIASRYSGKSLTRYAIYSSLANVSIDFVIDPAAVHAGFWAWTKPGFYYGVPFINFVGWIITGIIYSAIFYTFFLADNDLPLPSGVSTSIIWILSFWSGYNLLNMFFIPGILGIIEVIIFLVSYE